jgi:hypothetical protein
MRALVAAGVALTVLVLTGCAGNRAATPRSAATPGQGSPTTEGPSPLLVWIAVFRTAEDPNDLDAASRDLRRRAGDAVVVAPEGCFGGLRAESDVSPGDYVLGVLAGSRDDLEEAVQRAGEEPVATARAEDLCPE